MSARRVLSFVTIYMMLSWIGQGNAQSQQQRRRRAFTTLPSRN